MMERRDREALDRHITGNYGEDQFRDEPAQRCGCPAGSHWPECPMGYAPDTTNWRLVGSLGDHIVVAMGVEPGRALTGAEAVNLAAWLVAVTETQRDYGATFHTFEDTLEAIREA